MVILDVKKSPYNLISLISSSVSRNKPRRTATYLARPPLFHHINSSELLFNAWQWNMAIDGLLSKWQGPQG